MSKQKKPKSSLHKPESIEEAVSVVERGKVGTAARRSRLFFVYSLCISLLSTALHLPSLKGQLITDDLVLVADFDRRGCGPNPLDCFSNLIGHFYYRPMLPASFALGQKFHDNNPVWFHAENLVMHFLAVMVAFYAFRAIFRRRSTALAAGLLLSMHPVNVTVTSWIGGRTDTMALGFMALYALGTCRAGRLLRLRSCLPAAHPLRARMLTPGISWIVTSTSALLAAVFTKEQSIGLVFLAPMLALPLWGPTLHLFKGSSVRNGKKARSVPGKKLPYWTAIYLLPVVIFLLVIINVMKELNFDHAGWSAAMHIEMVGRTLCYYASEFFLPTVSDQHISTIGAWHAHQYDRALMGYLAATLWVALLVRFWADKRLRLLMLWASLSIGTVLNVVPIPNALAAPFRTAVAMFGVAGLLAIAFSPAEFPVRSARLRAIITPAARRAAMALMLAWYLVVTLQDIPNWMSEWTYSSAEMNADPNFVCARASVASGKFLRKDYRGALEEFDTCMEMLFGKDTPVESYVSMLRSPNMLPVMQSMSTLRYRPIQYIPQVIRERGRTLQILGRNDEAIRNLRVVLAITPDDTVARDALVASYLAIGKPEQAESVRRMEDVLMGKPL